MDEIRKLAAPRPVGLPKLPRTPFLTDVAALAVLGGGGYLALRLMEALFALCGVD